jgi:hypothetical protein
MSRPQIQSQYVNKECHSNDDDGESSQISRNIQTQK